VSKSQKKGKSFQGSVVPDYISELPDAIPPGRILVHNSVRPAKRMGYRGFRAWLSFPEPKYVICDCKWASNLGEHYRVGTNDPLRRGVTVQLPDVERLPEGRGLGRTDSRHSIVRLLDLYPRSSTAGSEDRARNVYA